MMKEIIFLSPTSLDDAGRVFFWRGDFYRAIYPGSEKFFRDLFKSGVADILMERGMGHAEIADFTLPDYPLVLKHKRIPYVSYPAEWGSAMLKDAALLIQDLSLTLFRHGLHLKDTHPWNVLFANGKPVFVDWGSICRAEDRDHWLLEEFIKWHVMPLALMSAGKSQMARAFLRQIIWPLTGREVCRMTFRGTGLGFWLRYRRFKKLYPGNPSPGEKCFGALRNIVESIPLEENKTPWTNYDGVGKDQDHEFPENWPVKIQRVNNILKSLRPKTMLDIGCNRGWFSEHATRYLIEVAAFDLDESSLNDLYRRASEKSLSILPSFMDFCNPTPSQRPCGAKPNAKKRFRSEMVIALGLTHHLVFKQFLIFDAIVKQLSEFTERWLIVEFVPPEDVHVNRWNPETRPWYNTAEFRKTLEKYFEKVEEYPSTPEVRRLFLCEKQAGKAIDSLADEGYTHAVQGD